MKETIILATNNKGKIKEMKQILKDKNIVSLEEASINIEVKEDKDTFEENSIKKAYEIWKLTKKACIADDSGLCIEILDGFPGVQTARFLGKNATQTERNEYILEKLLGIEKEKRKAKAITSIAIINSEGKYKVFKKCKKYLNHWQKSVFRGPLTNSQILELEFELKKIIDKKKDFISIIKIMDFKTIGETTLGNVEKNTEDIFL